MANPTGSRADEWNMTTCGGIALAFIAAGILFGVGWAIYHQNGNSSPSPAASTRTPEQSSAPTSNATYVPGQEPVYTPGAAPSPDTSIRPKAHFTMNWDKKTGILRLDASPSTPGYKYSWYFGWSVGMNTGTTPDPNPLYTTIVQESQIVGPGKNWVTLNLINGSRQIMGSEKQELPQ